MNRRRFLDIQRHGAHGCFGAIEYALREIEDSPNVTDLITYGTDDHEYIFLMNDERHAAIYTKVVMRQGNFLYRENI